LYGNPFGLPVQRTGLCTSTKPFGTSYNLDFAQGKTLRKALFVTSNTTKIAHKNITSEKLLIK
jgi:hypothetical protein